MKPTGATLEDADPVDRLLDVFRYSHDLDRSVAARLQIKSMINERERLREFIRPFAERPCVLHKTDCVKYGRERLCVSCQARAALNDAAGMRG